MVSAASRTQLCREHGSTPPLLDIPPRTRAVIIIVALAGIICIMMGSMIPGKGGSIQVDKLVHSIGYCMLGILMVMGLRPSQYFLGFLAVVFMGLALEYAQIAVGRVFDWHDAYYNVLGLAGGAGLGLLGRWVMAYLHSEMMIIAERRRLCRYADGEIIFNQGDPSDHLYVIRSGKVRITREQGDKVELLDDAEPGEVIGEMGVLHNMPRFATATAVGATVLYLLEGEELFKSIDGQEHPSSPVIRVLARRLRAADHHIDQFVLSALTTDREGEPGDSREAAREGNEAAG